MGVVVRGREGKECHNTEVNDDFRTIIIIIMESCDHCDIMFIIILSFTRTTVCYVVIILLLIRR